MPVAADTNKSSTEKQDAKRAASEAKKTYTQNHKIATNAAKTVGCVAQAEAALKAWELKAEQAKVGEDILVVSRPVSTKLHNWYSSARVAMDTQENNRSLPEGVAPTALQPLPWDAGDLKATLKQAAELQKTLKNCLPAKPKRAAPAGAAVEKVVTGAAQAPAGEGAPKRRRTRKSS